MKHASKASGYTVLVALIAGLAATAAGATAPEPGLRITAQNVDQYQDYLIESQIARVRQGEVLEVHERTPDEQALDPVWAAATESNRGRARFLDDAGTVGTEDGGPWPGGFPFPEPKSALEVMANFQLSLQDDDLSGLEEGQLTYTSDVAFVGASGNHYKRQQMGLSEYRPTARVHIDPKPAVPGHEHELVRTLSHWFGPYDVAGTSVLNIVYRDQKRLPDTYLYAPVLRRVKRLSSGQRADSIAGSDLTVGDVNTLGDPLGMWDFKLVGKRPMLTTFNNAYENPLEEMIAGRFPSPASVVELRDTYIIEATPRYDTIYSKKVLLIDAVTFAAMLGDFYDRQGKLYRAYALHYGIRPDNDNYQAPRWVNIYNMQTNTATIFKSPRSHKNRRMPLRYFEPGHLRAFAR